MKSNGSTDRLCDILSTYDAALFIKEHRDIIERSW